MRELPKATFAQAHSEITQSSVIRLLKESKTEEMTKRCRLTLQKAATALSRQMYITQLCTTIKTANKITYLLLHVGPIVAGNVTLHFVILLANLSL